MTRSESIQARRHSNTRSRQRIALVCALACAAPPVHAGGPPPGACQALPNGDFDLGLANWTYVPESSVDGDGFVTDGSGVFDASGHQLPDGSFFDSNTLTLALEAVAGYVGPPGSASITATVSNTTPAAARYVRLRRGGFFEFQFFGTGARAITAEAFVQHEGAVVASRTFYAVQTQSQPGCFPGLSVLGTFDSGVPEVYFDLYKAGIVLGQTVTVSVRLSVSAESIEPCQFVITTALLQVDDFEFCPTAPSPADIDRDDDVDSTDFDLFVGVLLGQIQHAVYQATADVNGDAFADGADVPAFVSAWLDAS